MALSSAHKIEIDGGSQPLRLGVAVRANRGASEDGIGCGARAARRRARCRASVRRAHYRVAALAARFARQRGRRFELFAVAQHGGNGIVIGKVMREGITGPDHGGELRAVAARAEQPDRWQRDVFGHGADRAERMVFREGAVLEQDELLEALQEIVVAAGVLPPPQCVGGDGIGAGRAAQPEIDAAGKQRLEHLEALGDHERRVVRQHDAARAHPHMSGRRCNLSDHDVGR